MFYEQDAIENALKCISCKNCFDVPKQLPCGQIVCELCVKQNTSSNGEMFKCNLCNDNHLIPQNGFQTLKVIENLLKIQPVTVFRGGLFNKLGKSLNQVKEKIRESKEIYETAEDLVRTRCDLIRDEIVIHFDSIQEEHDRIKVKQLNEIDEFEKNILNLVKNESKTMIEELKKSELLAHSWSQAYKKPQLSKNYIYHIIKASNQTLCELESLKVDFESCLKVAKLISYKRGKKKNYEKCVGSIVYDEKIEETSDEDEAAEEEQNELNNDEDIAEGAITGFTDNEDNNQEADENDDDNENSQYGNQQEAGEEIEEEEVEYGEAEYNSEDEDFIEAGEMDYHNYMD